MKKTILFLAVIALFTASSCKKYTCQCSDGSHSDVSGTNASQAESHCAAKGSATIRCTTY